MSSIIMRPALSHQKLLLNPCIEPASSHPFLSPSRSIMLLIVSRSETTDSGLHRARSAHDDQSTTRSRSDIKKDENTMEAMEAPRSSATRALLLEGECSIFREIPSQNVQFSSLASHARTQAMQETRMCLKRPCCLRWVSPAWQKARAQRSDF